MPQIRQLLFDCDNTLVFSEELAFEACSDVVNELLAAQGITDRYSTDQLVVEFLGQNFRGIMTALQTKYKFQLSAEQVAHYRKQEENGVIAVLLAKAYACDGATEVLEKLQTEHKYGLAVASSSSLRRIRAAIEKAGLDKFFNPDHVFSAVTSLDKPTSKPSPAVYLHAMEKLNVKPEECVTVEDSMSGATAAVRANIPCIAYVGAYSTKAKQDEVARLLTRRGCKAVMYCWNQYFDCLKKIETS